MFKVYFQIKVDIHIGLGLFREPLVLFFDKVFVFNYYQHL